MILGKGKNHHLQDSLEEQMLENCCSSCDNPLAVSHVTGKGKKQTFRRYDYLLKSRRWRTVDIEYAYEDSILASSDHAAVIGRFSFKA